MNRRLKELLILLFIYLAAAWLIATFVFMWCRVLPGDPALSYAPQGPGTLDEEYLESYYSVFGKPLFEQYADYLTRILTGQFYYSWTHHSPISSFIYDNMFWSLFLFSFSMSVSFLLAGLTFKYLAKPRDDSKGWFADGVSLVLFSVCPFVLSLGLIYTVGYTGLLPMGGPASYMYDSMSLGDKIVDAFEHAILPMLSLTIMATGGLLLMFRVGGRKLLAQERADSADLGHPRGPPLSSSARETIPYIHFLVAGLIGFLVVIEAHFDYAGIGWVLVQTLYMRDAFLLEACAFLIPVIVLTYNVVIESMTCMLDPRLSRRASFPSSSREDKAVFADDAKAWPGVMGLIFQVIRRPGGMIGSLIILVLICVAAIGMTLPDDPYDPFSDEYDAVSATLRGAGTPVSVVLLVMFVCVPAAIMVGYLVAAMRTHVGEAGFLVELPARSLSYCFIALGVVVPLFCFTLMTVASHGFVGSTGSWIRVALLSSFSGLFLLCYTEGVMRISSSSRLSSDRRLGKIIKSESFVSVAAQAFRGCKFIAPLTALGIMAADHFLPFGWTSWGTAVMELVRTSLLHTDASLLIPPGVAIAALIIGTYLLADSAEKVLSKKVRV